MLGAIKEWIIHLFSVHCADCIKPCASCETLRLELALAHQLNRELLNKLFPEKESIEELSDAKPISPQYIPWSVRKRQLELIAKERAQAAKIEKDIKSTEELEKELGVEVNG